MPLGRHTIPHAKNCYTNNIISLLSSIWPQLCSTQLCNSRQIIPMGLHKLKFACTYVRVITRVRTIIITYSLDTHVATPRSKAYIVISHTNVNTGPVFSYKLRYIVRFGLVEMAIATNPKRTIYRNLYEEIITWYYYRLYTFMIITYRPYVTDSITYIKHAYIRDNKVVHCIILRT